MIEIAREIGWWILMVYVFVSSCVGGYVITTAIANKIRDWAAGKQKQKDFEEMLAGMHNAQMSYNHFPLPTTSPYAKTYTQPLTISSVVGQALAGAHAYATTTFDFSESESTPLPTVQRDEPIRGWRGMEFVNGYLRGMAGWEWSSARMTAECHWGIGESPSAHIAISGDHPFHHCGIYGMADLNPDRYGDDDIHAWVRCVAWGTVGVDADGNWRATEVEMEEIFLVKELFANATWLDFDKIADCLQAVYSIPVHVVDTVSELVVQAQPEVMV